MALKPCQVQRFLKKNIKRCICYRIMLLLKIYLANGVILYVDRNQAKRVEKEDEGCDGKKSNIFSWRWSFTIEVKADIQFTRRRRSLKKDRY